MIADTHADTARIHEQWHRAVVGRDFDGLMALYDEDAIFESPLVWALQPTGNGILRGKASIGRFFDGAFRTPATGLGRWHRTGTFFGNDRRLIWEYPRETPDGDQIDLVEVMDLRDGRILLHRVYWGWVGVSTLSRMPSLLSTEHQP